MCQLLSPRSFLTRFNIPSRMLAESISHLHLSDCSFAGMTTLAKDYFELWAICRMLHHLPNRLGKLANCKSQLSSTQQVSQDQA